MEGKKGKEGTKKEKWNVLEEVVGKREREREKGTCVEEKKRGGEKEGNTDGKKKVKK